MVRNNSAALLDVCHLAALLAHEIKTPMSGIRAAELITRADDHEKQHQMAQLIISETDRVTELANRMETLAAGNTINRKPINIHEIIDHCLHLMNRVLAKALALKNSMIRPCQIHLATGNY